MDLSQGRLKNDLSRLLGFTKNDGTSPARRKEDPALNVFEPHHNPLNVSTWVPFGPHFVSASGAPGHNRRERWALAGVTDVVTLQRGNEMSSGLEAACLEHGWRWHHFPLSGKRLAVSTDAESLRALAHWSRALAQEPGPKRVVLHCSAGLHRTGAGLYTLFRTYGMTRAEALQHIAYARPLTHHELTRHTRRNGRMIDDIETRFGDLWATEQAP